MITPKKLTRKQAVKILRLFDKYTRAEVMSRVGPSAGLEFQDYYQQSLDLRDELREMIYGTSDFVQLGIKFGMLESDGRSRRKKKKKKRKSH